MLVTNSGIGYLKVLYGKHIFYTITTVISINELTLGKNALRQPNVSQTRFQEKLNKQRFSFELNLNMCLLFLTNEIAQNLILPFPVVVIGLCDVNFTKEFFENFYLKIKKYRRYTFISPNFKI